MLGPRTPPPDRDRARRAHPSPLGHPLRRAAPARRSWRLLAGLLLAAAALARGAGAAPSARLELSAGLELEGLRESFGFESLFDAGESDLGSITAAGSRYHEVETELLGLLGLHWVGGTGRAWEPTVAVDLRAGELRRSLSVGGEARCRAGLLQGLLIRNHLSVDDEEDRETGERLESGQNLLTVRWQRDPTELSRHLVLRSTLDLSWGSAEPAPGDTAVAAYAEFLNHRKWSLGVGIASSGFSSSSLFFDLARKWTDAAGSTAYTSAALTWDRNRFALDGGLDLQARAERRRYEASGEPDSLGSVSSALRSYYELELYARWRRPLLGGELEASGRAVGDLYDGDAEAAGEADSLLPLTSIETLNRDRLRLEVDLLLFRNLRRWSWESVLEDTLARSAVERVRLGAGPAADILWGEAGSGDYRSFGGRAEIELRGGSRLGDAWIELGIELGRRSYRGTNDALVFDLGTTSFSLAQTDFTYTELSLIGGGRLPLGLEWQGYAFLEDERHTAAEDDVRLFSISAALLRRWGAGR
jgi:hypothetical protein